MSASALPEERGNFGPHRIATARWRRVLEDEETYGVADAICREIIDASLHKCYESYLKRISPLYIVHCAHAAWIEFFERMHLHGSPSDCEFLGLKFTKKLTSPNLAKCRRCGCKKTGKFN